MKTKDVISFDNLSLEDLPAILANYRLALEQVKQTQNQKHFEEQNSPVFLLQCIITSQNKLQKIFALLQNDNEAQALLEQVLDTTLTENPNDINEFHRALKSALVLHNSSFEQVAKGHLKSIDNIQTIGRLLVFVLLASALFVHTLPALCLLSAALLTYLVYSTLRREHQKDHNDINRATKRIADLQNETPNFASNQLSLTSCKQTSEHRFFEDPTAKNIEHAYQHPTVVIAN